MASIQSAPRLVQCQHAGMLLVVVVCLCALSEGSQRTEAAEEGAGAYEGEIEEEKRASASVLAVAVAATLMGAITFQMVLFCMTNHPDEDMRKYTYQVVSATVSIFCAVVLFQSANDIVEACLLVGMPEEQKVVCNFAHMLFWYAAMEGSLAWFSGAIGAYPASKKLAINNMKSIGVVTAHMTGFASINAWGSIQQLPSVRESCVLCFAVVPIGLLGQVLLQRVTHVIRSWVALSDDGKWDEFEELWNETTEECENDVLALTVSYNMVQASRFFISGVLPSEEGEEPWSILTEHTNAQISLMLLGAVFCILVLALSHFTRAVDEKQLGPVFLRALEVTHGILCMGFSWNVFYGAKWFLASIPALYDSMLLSVVLAMVMSLCSFASIRLLDLLADADFTGDKVDDAIRMLIGAFAILVGFSWEQCFDDAVISISTVMPYRQLSKLAMSLLAVSIIFPAWKWWILPMVDEEGWMFGFIVDHEDDKWEEVFEHWLKKKNEHAAAANRKHANLLSDKLLTTLKELRMGRRPSRGLVHCTHLLEKALSLQPRDTKVPENGDRNLQSEAAAAVSEVLKGLAAKDRSTQDKSGPDGDSVEEDSPTAEMLFRIVSRAQRAAKTLTKKQALRLQRRKSRRQSAIKLASSPSAQATSRVSPLPLVKRSHQPCLRQSSIDRGPPRASPASRSDSEDLSEHSGSEVADLAQSAATPRSSSVTVKELESPKRDRENLRVPDFGSGLPTPSTPKAPPTPAAAAREVERLTALKELVSPKRDHGNLRAPNYGSGMPTPTPKAPTTPRTAAREFERLRGLQELVLPKFEPTGLGALAPSTPPTTPREAERLRRLKAKEAAVKAQKHALLALNEKVDAMMALAKLKERRRDEDLLAPLLARPTTKSGSATRLEP